MILINCILGPEVDLEYIYTLFTYVLLHREVSLTLDNLTPPHSTPDICIYPPPRHLDMRLNLKLAPAFLEE